LSRRLRQRQERHTAGLRCPLLRPLLAKPPAVPDPEQEMSGGSPVPFTKTIEVRFADCDMMQHVNNAVYLHYLEEARVHYYRELSGGETLEDIDIILGEVRIRYLSPAAMGELLDVTARVTDMRRSSFAMAYDIVSRRDGRTVATAETVQVMFDYDRHASKPIPDAFRARVAAAEGREFPAPAA